MGCHVCMIFSIWRLIPLRREILPKRILRHQGGCEGDFSREKTIREMHKLVEQSSDYKLLTTCVFFAFQKFISHRLQSVKFLLLNFSVAIMFRKVLGTFMQLSCPSGWFWVNPIATEILDHGGSCYFKCWWKKCLLFQKLVHVYLLL